MADFIDFFVMGEGEDVIIEIILAMREVQQADRDTQLRRLARIPGVYVPRFYAPSYYEADGTLSNIEPLVEEADSHHCQANYAPDAATGDPLHCAVCGCRLQSRLH